MVDVAAIAAKQRALTQRYIDYDPTTIILIPTVKTHTDSGSDVWTDGPPRMAQTFKLITIEATAHGHEPVSTQDGVERIINAVLLGAWDSVMEVGDHWRGADGRRYTIIALEDGHGYAKKGLVEAHG